jgi:Flp pilus assembly protein TadD
LRGDNIAAMRRLATFAFVIASGATAACGSPDGAPGRRSIAPTYNRDIAPLVWNHCGTCHRPGQLAPFSLLDYVDVRTHARQIVTATRNHVMPPWLPEPGYGLFSNDRRLPPDDVDRVAQWVDRGMPEGDPADRPSPPTWVDGWQLGQPDLVVELPEAYILKPGKADVFRNFVIPIPLSSMRYVRGMEVRPGNSHVVHHATLGIDRTRTSRLLDEADPEPGYEGMFADGAHSPENHALGWTPGMVPEMEPADMAWRLESGSDLVIQLHMMPEHLREPAAVRPSVGLFFTDTPPTRFPMDFKLGSKFIDIPAGQADYTTEDVYRLPVDVDVLSVYPHAHYLGKEMKAFVTLPGGTTTWLLWIKDWNFSWQDQYRYKSPVSLPKGAVVTMRYTYDNSAANPRNPARPPVHVTYGPQSTDEMGDLWLRLLPHSRADAAILARAFVENELRKDLIVAERGVAAHPNDARWHNLLGTRYLESGRLTEGAAQLQTAVRLMPRDAEARNNFAQALQSEGRLADALEQFQEASRLAPNNDQVHANLAAALQDHGDLDGAIRHLRAAVTLNPHVAETRNNLGVALGSRGMVSEAIVEFRRALEIRPDYGEAQKNLATALDLQRRRPSPR